MPKTSSTIADILSQRFNSLERTRSKVERLHLSSKINRHDIELVYEGLFLSTQVAFESFIEDLFVGLLIKKRGLKSSRADIIPRISLNSHNIAYDLLIGIKPKKYIEWLPYEHTLDFAEIYFRGGRPFSELDEQQKNHIQKCCTIRNAIAHKSDFSLSQFKKKIIGNLNIPPHEKIPSGYLRGMFRVAPTQTRYENLISELLMIARFLAR